MEKQNEIDFFKKSTKVEKEYSKFYEGALSGLVIGGFASAIAASLGVDNFTTDSLRFIGTVASSVAFINYVKKPKYTTTAMLMLGGMTMYTIAPIALVAHIGTTLGSMGMTGLLSNFVNKKKNP